MEFDGVVGVLERVAGEHQNHGLVGGDDALGAQFLQPGQGDGRGRLAAQSFGAELGLGDGDLRLGHVEAPAAGLLNDPRRLAPGGGIADANGGGAGVRLDRLQALRPRLQQGCGPADWRLRPE